MGTSFGRYKVAEEIGRGAMGVVYRAVDPSIGRSVAVKAINRTYLESVGVAPGEYGERFQREAQVAGALNHPHIVKIFDLGPDYIVMEYVEGQTLAALLRQRGRLSREVALRLLGEAASALDHAHQSGIVHRDIKPANVMVQPDGSVKVMDFGLARIESSTLTAAGEVLGSAAYMAPEVVLGQPADARSDIFSLAVVAYELLAGVRPFAGPTVSAIIQSVVRTTPRPVRELDASLQAEVDVVFARALAKEPSERFGSAGDFVQALSAAAWGRAGETAAPLAGLVDGGDVGEATVILETASTIRMPQPQPAPEEVTTILSVEADELAGGEAASPVSQGESDASATVILTPRVAPDREPELESTTPATVMLRAPQSQPSPSPDPTPSPESDVAATVVLQAGMRAPAAPPADEAPAEATVILKRAAPSDPAPSVAAQPESATMRLAPVPPAAPEPPTSGPNDPTLLAAPPTSRGPVTPPAAPAPASATVTLSAAALTPQPATPASSPAAPSPDSATVTLPAEAPVPPRPSAAPPTPPLPQPPPARSTPPAPPVAPPPATAPPVAAQPAAKPATAAPAKRGSGAFVAGLVVLLLVLFAAAVAAFFWIVRSRQSAAGEPTPAPAAESTPAAVDAPQETAPPPETLAAEPPIEASAVPETAPAATPAPDAAPRTATLTIDSEPSGASVTIGRRNRGRTPLKLTLPAGSAAVVVEKDGYKPWRETARLKAGESRSLRAQLEAVPAPRPVASAAAPPPKPAVREGDLVPLGPDVTPPRKLSGPSPNIPDKVRRNLNGSVVVVFVVDVDGSTSSARVAEPLNLVVDKAALDAVARFRYEPARMNGVRVRVEQRAKFTFVSQ